MFTAGVEAMVSTLDPRLLLVYGKMPMDPGCEVIEYRPDWTRLRKFNRPEYDFRLPFKKGAISGNKRIAG